MSQWGYDDDYHWDRDSPLSADYLPPFDLPPTSACPAPDDDDDYESRFFGRRDDSIVPASDTDDEEEEAPPKSCNAILALMRYLKHGSRDGVASFDERTHTLMIHRRRIFVREVLKKHGNDHLRYDAFYRAAGTWFTKQPPAQLNKMPLHWATNPCNREAWDKLYATV